MLRQLELLAEDLRQFVERDVDLERVLPGASPACPSPSPSARRLALARRRPDRRPLLVLAEPEARQFDLRQRDRNDVALALLADQLARG
jgi:hypothetical protein